MVTPCVMTGVWMDALPRTLAEGSAVKDNYWIVVAFAMLVASYLIMRPKKRKDPLDRPARFSPAQERGVEREMQNLLVELSQMTQKMSAQLDTRSAKLEALLREADGKIALLKAELEIKPMPAPGPRLVTDSIEPEPVDQRYIEIYAMADRGVPVREIAQKLGRPSGEVELILALRQNTSRKTKEINEA
ncbi:MAG TPA: hypothetical protein VGG19_17740 [Tepidisphaeraceae bacterium]